MNFHMKEQEIDFLKEEHANEHVDAELVHWQAQEVKMAEIKHKYAETQAYKKEAEAPSLKVKLTEMVKSSSSLFP